MLECLGVPWVQAAGEAEAMCAYLNLNGYVDACITNDGDAFLYGAQTVYRNFTMNIKVLCFKELLFVNKLKDENQTGLESFHGLLKIRSKAQANNNVVCWMLKG